MSHDKKKSVYYNKSYCTQKNYNCNKYLLHKNSRFFHLSTIIERRRNNIDAIKNTNGTWIRDVGKIKHMFQEGFKTIYIEDQVDFPMI